MGEDTTPQHHSITPHIEANHPMMPTYTIADVYEYISKQHPMVNNDGSMWVEEIKFAREGVFGEVGPQGPITNPDRLVCIARIRGNFHHSGPPGWNGWSNICQFIFDGKTGSPIDGCLTGTEEDPRKHGYPY
jgi:hypothetical protein